MDAVVGYLNKVEKTYDSMACQEKKLHILK